MIVLTNDNYHSLEANQDYLSCSQYKGFLECEAKELAKISGAWEDILSTALEVGQYVHSWNAARMMLFIETHPNMFKVSGDKGLKADYVVANRMIECLQEDDFAMACLVGDKETILTADLYGATWKIMPDVLDSTAGRIVDLTTTSSINEKVWQEASRSFVPFFEFSKKPLKMAIYSEVERLAAERPAGSYVDYLLVAVSKEKQPDKAVIRMTDSERLSTELQIVGANMPRIIGLKAGLTEPIRCEKCSYCRSTKELNGIIPYSVLLAYTG